MKFNTIYFLVFTILINSCSKRADVGDALKTIHLTKSKDVLPISIFIKDLDYLELKFPSNKIEIGEIKDLKIIDNEIIIKQRKAKEISFLRFSKDGTYKNKITQNGKEIPDLLLPRDIIQYQNDYAIWGQSGIHIISKNGKYKEKLFDVNKTGNSFLFSKNSFFLFHESTSPGYLSQYNVKGTQEKIYNPTNRQISDLGYSKIFPQGKENHHLFSPMTDTVFSFFENEIIPKYILDGSPFTPFMQILKNVEDLEKQEALKYINENQHVVVKNYLENKNYIFITYWVGSNSSNVLIDKKNWESIYFSTGINDIDGGIWDTPLYLSDDDILYIPINSYKIGSHKIVNKKRKGFSKLKEKTQFGDNPIIMRCKLK